MRVNIYVFSPQNVFIPGCIQSGLQKRLPSNILPFKCWSWDLNRYQVIEKTFRTSKFQSGLQSYSLHRVARNVHTQLIEACQSKLRSCTRFSTLHNKFELHDIQNVIFCVCLNEYRLKIIAIHNYSTVQFQVKQPIANYGIYVYSLISKHNIVIL